MTSEVRSGGDQGQHAAYEILKVAAAAPDVVKDYRTIAAAFTDADYRQVVALAWRYQFSDSRYEFKRELNELQQHVTARVRTDTEGVS